MSPSVVHPSGGTALAIKGSFGRGVFYCRVGTIGPIAASSVDAGTVECVAPARDEGAAVVTVASGFGDVHRRGEVSLAYELPRVKKADEDKPPEPEVAAVVPFAGPLGGGSPRVRRRQGAHRARLLVHRVWRRDGPVARGVLRFGHRRGAPGESSRVGGCARAPRVSAACSRTSRTSTKVPSAEPAVVGTDGGATITLVGASLGSGRTARTACRIGTLGPIAASYAGGYRFECRAPATIIGTRTVAAGTHDGSAWTAGGSLLATHAPRGVFASPPATPSGTDVLPAAVSFFGLWLHKSPGGGFESSSVSIVDAGSDSRFVAVRIDHSRHASALSFDNLGGVHAFVERFAAPKVRSVASFGGGIEGGSLAYVFGGDFDDFNSASCVFASRSHGFDVLPASAVSVAADVVSGALIRCETPALVDGMAANMFGYGGGDASLHVMHRGGLAVSPDGGYVVGTTHALDQGDVPGGRVGVGRYGPTRHRGGGGRVDPVAPVAGSRYGGSAPGWRRRRLARLDPSAPVATREGGAFTDVECVVPAGLGAVDVRIFSQRSVCLPRSPRAAPNGGVGAFAYATEGRVYDALPGSFGPGFGRTGSEVAVLGAGLTLPRGAAVACLVDGDATRALSATSSSAVNVRRPARSERLCRRRRLGRGGFGSTSRSQSPRTYASSPSAVDAGGGGVLSLHGVDMHRAVGFTFGGDDGAMVSSALGVVVSSALAVVEAPGAGKVVNQPAGAVVAVAVAVGATRGGPIGYDAAGPAPPSSASVWLTPRARSSACRPRAAPRGAARRFPSRSFPSSRVARDPTATLPARRPRSAGSARSGPCGDGTTAPGASSASPSRTCRVRSRRTRRRGRMRAPAGTLAAPGDWRFCRNFGRCFRKCGNSQRLGVLVLRVSVRPRRAVRDVDAVRLGRLARGTSRARGSVRLRRRRVPRRRRGPLAIETSPRGRARLESRR